MDENNIQNTGKRKRGRPRKSESDNNESISAARANAKLRKCLTDFSVRNFRVFSRAYEDVVTDSPKDACKIYTDILKFVTPQIQSTALDVNDERDKKSYKDRIIEMRDNSIKNTNNGE